MSNSQGITELLCFPYVYLHLDENHRQESDRYAVKYELDVLGWINNLPVLKPKETSHKCEESNRRNAPSTSTKVNMPIECQSGKRSTDSQTLPNKRICIKRPICTDTTTVQPKQLFLKPVNVIRNPVQTSTFSPVKSIFIKGRNGNVIKLLNKTEPVTCFNAKKLDQKRFVNSSCQTDAVEFKTPVSVTEKCCQTDDDGLLLDIEVDQIFGDLVPVVEQVDLTNMCLASKSISANSAASPIVLTDISHSNYYGKNAIVSQFASTSTAVCSSAATYGKNIDNWNVSDAAVPVAAPKHIDWKESFCMDLLNCNKMDEASGLMPIHNAVIQNDVKAVYRQTLVIKMRRIDINIENDAKLTPFQLAIKYSCDRTIFQILLYAGADLSVLDVKGNNIFHLATQHSQIETLENLWNLVSNPLSIVNDYNYAGDTPLIICAQNDQVAMADVLLQAGAFVNLQDKKAGKTALFYAVENDFADMVKLLMSFGANPKICNFSGLSVTDALPELTCCEDTLKQILGKSWINFVANNSSAAGNRNKSARRSNARGKTIFNASKSTFKTPATEIRQIKTFPIKKRTSPNDTPMY